MTEQIKFIKGEVFSLEEGKAVEFKAVQSKIPVSTITNHAEQYITAFLNASIEGNLYIGIQDNGEIIGISLTRDDKDRIQKDITCKISNIKDPSIPPSCYDIYIHDIYDIESNKLDDLYIVRIHVFKIEQDYLYRTSDREFWFYKTNGGSTYLKKESSCIKLNSQQIAEEIKVRSQKYLNKQLEDIDNKILKDPENISFLNEKIRIARSMGNVEVLDKTYEKLLELKPDSSETRIAHASDHKSFGDLEGALSIVNDALQLDKNNFDCLKIRGEILSTSDRASEAIQDYESALKIDPNDYTILTQIGITLRELGRYKESIEYLNLALSKSPSYRAAKYEKNKTYSKMFQRGSLDISHPF